MTRSRRNLLLLSIVYGLAAVRIVQQAMIDLAAGGSDWRQGDWLINAEAGPIRRGLSGSALIALSDATGLPLLGLALAVPLILLAIWVVSILLFATREGPGDRLLLLLLSSGFVPFWGADPEGAFRKELLVYVAFLPLVAAAGRPGRDRALLALAVTLYAVAAGAHEIAVFFAPAMILAIAACRPRDRASDLAMAAVLGLAALSLVQTVRHIIVVDPALVCAPLVARGLSPEICKGSIAWLAYDWEYVRGQVAQTWANPHAWTVPIGYALALMPFFVVLGGSPRPWRKALVILALGLPFLPLWAVAVDWGRWVNAHVTVAVVIALILIRRDRARWLRAPLPGWIMVLVLVPSLTLCMRHLGGDLIAGIVPVPRWLGFLR